MDDELPQRPRFLDVLSKRLFVPVLGWFFFIGSLPMIALGIGYYRHVARLLQREHVDRLSAIAQRQVNSIENTIYKTGKLLEVFSGTRRMAALVPALQKARQEGNEAFQEEVNLQCDTLIGHPSKELGFDDLVLFDVDGHPLYAASRTSMFQLGVLNPEFKYPNLRAAFDKAIIHLSTQVAKLDLESIYGAPAFFMVTPIIIEQRLLAVGMVRLNSKDIHRISNDYNGLGVTGETLLISPYKDDYILFNPTRFGMEPGLNSTVTPGTRHLDLMRNCLQTGSGSGDGLDYRQQRVVASWNYIPSVHWGILVKSDVAEIFKPMEGVRNYAFVIGSLTSILLVFASSFVAANLSQSFRFFARATVAITRGQLYFDFSSVRGKGQLELFGIVRFLLDSLLALRTHLDEQLKHHKHEIEAIADDVAIYMDTNRNLEQYICIVGHKALHAGALAKDVAQDLQRITEMTERIALGAESGLEDLKIIRDSFERLDVYNKSLKAHFDLIEKASNSARAANSSLVHLCDSINLIFINSMIEAQKAGAQGLGFKVIAQEIQKFSQDLSALTADIENYFADMCASVGSCLTQGRETAHRFGEETQLGLRAFSQLLDVIQQVQSLPSVFENTTQRTHSQERALSVIRGYAHSLRSSSDELNTAFDEIQKSLQRLCGSCLQVQKNVRRFHA